MKVFTFPVINACCHLSISLENSLVQRERRGVSVLHLRQYQQRFVMEGDGIETEEELGSKQRQQLWLIR